MGFPGIIPAIIMLKSGVSVYIYSPLSKNVIRYGKKLPIFKPTCSLLTSGVYNVQGQYYQHILKKPFEQPQMTDKVIERVGGGIITWMILSGGILSGYYLLKPKKI